jgi:nucleotide-binding universal stress UspA family protein
MYRTIAVPLDGSEYAEGALAYAAALARRSGGTVDLLHVHRPYRPGEAQEALPIYRWELVAEFDDEMDEEAFRGERDAMAARAEALREAGIDVMVRVVRGIVGPAVIENAQVDGADSVVMATHGHGGLLHAWRGGVTGALIRNTHVPVLLVHPDGPLAPDEVQLGRALVALDGTPHGEAILEPIAALARAFGTELTLLHVAPMDDRPFDAVWPFPIGAMVAANARGYLERAAGLLPGDLPAPDLRVVRDRRPAKAILRAAEEGGFDLIAMATHGPGGLHHLFVGSVADQVVRGTTRPVLLMRPPSHHHAA